MIFVLLTAECSAGPWRGTDTKIHTKMGLSHRRVNVCALILGKIDRWRKASALHLDQGRTKSGPLAAFGRRDHLKIDIVVLNMFCQYWYCEWPNNLVILNANMPDSILIFVFDVLLYIYQCVSYIVPSTHLIRRLRKVKLSMCLTN
jgi:hypothetical protein